MKTESDFVKPVLDSQVPFVDMGMKVRFKEDDYGQVMESVAHTAEEIDDLALFDPEVAKECPNFTKVFVESLEETARILPEDLHICGLSWGPITSAGYVMGAENMIFNMLVDEDLVKKLITKITKQVSDMNVRMVEAGATLMWMADPTSSEDLISPDMFRDFSAPHIKKCVSDVKAMDNTVPAFVHICGNTIDTLPQLPGTGADCLSFDHAVDAGKAKEIAGNDITLMGNIDPVAYIMSSTPEKITKECYRILDVAGQDSGFILAPGCETPISSPDENVIAMGKAGYEYWQQKH